MMPKWTDYWMNENEGALITGNESKLKVAIILSLCFLILLIIKTQG